MKKLDFKLELLAIIGIFAAIFYLWGWVYLANYYNYYGLPFSFAGTFHPQAVMLAGVAEFSDMCYKMLWWIVGLIAILFILHYTIPQQIKEKIVNAYNGIPYKQLLLILVLIIVFPLFFRKINDYVREDALTDSRNKTEFMTKCTYRVFPKNEQVRSYANLDSLVLLENKEGLFYFYKETNQPQIIIIPQTEVSIVQITGTKK